jgi:hypothetical protein
VTRLDHRCHAPFGPPLPCAFRPTLLVVMAGFQPGLIRHWGRLAVPLQVCRPWRILRVQPMVSYNGFFLFSKATRCSLRIFQSVITFSRHVAFTWHVVHIHTSLDQTVNASMLGCNVASIPRRHVTLHRCHVRMCRHVDVVFFGIACCCPLNLRFF